MMIQKIDAQIDHHELLKLYYHAEQHHPWTDSFPTFQSGISVAAGSEGDFLKCCGGNFSREQEKLYSQLHVTYQNSYISKLSSLLNLKIYRMRWMKLAGKGCYSLHRDWTRRLHIPIITSPGAFILFQNPTEMINLETKYAYVVDTTKFHTAMNTADDERVHLIACIEE